MCNFEEKQTKEENANYANVRRKAEEDANKKLKSNMEFIKLLNETALSMTINNDFNKLNNLDKKIEAFCIQLKNKL